MKELKMSWKTEEGRLVCHLIESAAAWNTSVALKRINPLTPPDDLWQPLALSHTKTNWHYFGLPKTDFF